MAAKIGHTIWPTVGKGVSSLLGVLGLKEITDHLPQANDQDTTELRHTVENNFRTLERNIIKQAQDSHRVMKYLGDSMQAQAQEIDSVSDLINSSDDENLIDGVNNYAFILFSFLLLIVLLLTFVWYCKIRFRLSKHKKPELEEQISLAEIV